MSPMPAQAGAAMGGRSWDLDYRVERDEGDEGVIFATGTENSGFSLFIQDDRLVFDYNAFGAHEVVVSDRPVPVGSSGGGVRVRRTGRSTGTAELVVQGEPAGSIELPLFMLMMSSVGPSVGYDHGSPVSDRYEAPFRFSGRLVRVDIDVDPAGKHRAVDDAEAAEVAGRAELSRQ
jgi:arylsulfatase